jgi:cytochrome c peroxidase
MRSTTAPCAISNPAEPAPRRLRPGRCRAGAGARWRGWVLGAALAGALVPLVATADDDHPGNGGDRRPDGGELHRNPSGAALTLSTAGRIDRRSLFFASLGSNGRSCGTCHQAEDGWTITPGSVRERFEASRGTDPIFRPVDGANSPNADVSTRAAREKAYSMLLSRGVIRVGMPVPPTAQFDLVAVDDPYGYASAAELSLFRRPLATTNLRFLSTVMWDGRETFKDPAGTDCIFNTTTCFATVHFDLADQSNTATVNHAQASTVLTTAQREAIVDFELGLSTAQVRDDDAGRLNAYGGHGGPQALQGQIFYFGINDTLAGDYRSHASFNPTGMTLYDAWKLYIPDARREDEEGRDRRVAVARRAVARGEALFNSKPIIITGVKGLNDDLGVASIAGTCTTCHDAPNAGDHSVPLPLDIGLADASRRTPDLPLYTLRNKSTGETIQTTDPGRALVTGVWKDIGRFKGPTLRALAARAPYFHNGFAKDLGEVVKFYNDRFGIGFNEQEKEDLIAFLKTL